MNIWFLSIYNLFILSSTTQEYKITMLSRSISMGYSHVFGPVSSRRLGRSLGVDLVPYKVCSFNCVYCEVGTTTRKTIHRKDFFPPSKVEDELVQFLTPAPVLDYITLSGSGEPTLSRSLGRILRFVKTRFPRYPVAVLTNGSLLWDTTVQKQLLAADVVLPTLSTVDEDTFQKIHRPAPELSIEQIIRGLEEFRNVYHGEIWIEVFLIPGVNMDPGSLVALSSQIRKIRPEKVHLNTLDRPGTEPWVRPASREELAKAGRLMNLPWLEPIRAISYGSSTSSSFDDPAAAIREILKRRPSTVVDLAAATGMHLQEIGKILKGMSEDPRLSTTHEERGIFYSWAES